MRMFLVGMCDVFLLLYLTAVSELDSRPVSSLTVKDYVALKESREDINRRKAEAEHELKQKEKDLQDVLSKISRLENKANELEKDKHQTVEAAKKTLSELERTKEQLSAKQQKLSSLESKANSLAEENRKAIQISQKTAKELQAAKLLVAEKEKLAEETLRREKDLALLKVKLESDLAATAAAAAAAAEKQKAQLEQAQRQAKEAAEEAQQAKKAQAEAEAQTQEARKLQGEAQLTAEIAKRREVIALSEKTQAEAQAADARVLADSEAARAEHASQQSAKAKEKIKAITQSARKAYQNNIARKLAPLKIRIKSKGLLGSSREEKTLYGVPVTFNAEQVLFVPLEQSGLDDVGEPNDVTSMKAQCSGETVDKMYISRSEPYIIGFSFSGQGEAARPLSDPSFSAYMPTLIAVRNGAAFGLSDRLRGLARDHFLFERDRLQPRPSGHLEYHSKGFRGTGDYAEYLVQGDQIVDLEGSFIGVAGTENTIVPISDISGWETVDLRGAASEAIRNLQKVLKRN